MSFANVNEDLLFYTKEDCLNSKKYNNQNNCENRNSKKLLKNNTTASFSKEIKMKKNSFSENLKKFEKIENFENLIENENIFIQHNRNVNFYQNLENLISEDDNTFSFENVSKNVQKLDNYSNQKSNLENHSFNLEDNNYSSYKNIYSKNNKNIFSDDKKSGKWSDEEDKILIQLVPLHSGKNWKKIAENIKGRSPIQCLHRWTKILQPGLVKGPWTIDEDRKLLEWIRKEGPVKWTQCSEYIKGRNGKQCRERWFHTLNPKVVKGNWTNEEDFKIFTLFKKIGGKWSKIALNIIGRTENSIKNRFYSTLRRKAVEQSKSNNISNDLNNLNSENQITKNNKKSNCNSNILTSNLSLEDLLEFLPQALFEVKMKYLKENNLTTDDIDKREKEITQAETLREQKTKIDYLKVKLQEENSLNMQINKNKIPPPQTINVNVNFNSNLNNYIIGNNEILYDKKNSNDHNDLFNRINKEDNLNYQFNNNKIDFSNQGNDYKNLDLFTLENNIIEMCENPSFMYSENNFNFLDGQVDNMIDSLFLNNNIKLTNDQDKDCNLCFNNIDQIPSNFINEFNNNDKIIPDCELKKLSRENYENINLVEEENQLNSIQNNSMENLVDFNSNVNVDGSLKNQNYFASKTNAIIKSSNQDFVLAEEVIEKNLNNFEINSNVYEKSSKNKKDFLSSLINQLEDLEKLVKNTKKELMKYNEKELDENDKTNEAILSTVYLTNTIQKIFK